ncbi:hypothetical protein ACQP3D_30695, partial [Escherichia coli]
QTYMTNGIFVIPIKLKIRADIGDEVLLSPSLSPNMLIKGNACRKQEVILRTQYPHLQEGGRWFLVS